MSDSKDYVSRADELGNIHISEEVLAAISAAAALEVEGVSSLGSQGKKTPPGRSTSSWRRRRWWSVCPC